MEDAMAENRNYDFIITLSVDCTLTQKEKDLLACELDKLTDKMIEILDEKPVKGKALIYSK
jgi:hypothetical protein